MSETYLGNPNLKRSNVSLEYTEEQITEYVKCAKDPEYFIRTYVKIVNIDKGFIPFEPYEFQVDIIDAVVDNRFVICKMPRQSGKTTTIAALLLHQAVFNIDFNIAILANKLAQAREILSRIQRAYEALPKWLQQGVVEWNKGNIELENGSKILASATSSSAIRGGSFNLIYLDEFAFVPKNLQDDFFASVYPTISSGNTSKVLITSTPNGLDMFYKIWVDSENNRNAYKRIDVHWSDVPGRDAKWKAETIQNTSEDQFRVEFECEFLGSSNTLISPSTLRRLVYKDPIRSKNNLDIYEEAQPDRVYAIVVDVSRGIGLDYSVFTVFDVTNFPYKQVAKYRDNNVEPVLFPAFVKAAGNLYNDAYVLIEINDIGGQVADIMHHEYEYENILMTNIRGASGQTIGGGFGQGSQLGVRTTKAVKRLGCSNLKTMIENDQIIINDFQTIKELSSFVSKGKSYEAESGENDDLVMTLVLFAWLVEQKYFKEVTNLDFRAKLYEDKIKGLEDSLTPFGFIDDGAKDSSFVDDSGQSWTYNDVYDAYDAGEIW
jgi:hypothetical protein